MKWLVYDVTKLVCWLVFRFRFGLEVSGQQHVPARGAFIAASNHVSFLDPPLVGVTCPRRLRFMARADLYHHPRLAMFLNAFRVIPLKRGEADLHAVREALACLRRGEPVAIFPEGGRQLSGVLGEARRGVGLLALAAQVPIIPVFVQGTFQALPPGAKRLQPSKIGVAFGEPIPYTDEPPSLQERRRAGAAGLPAAPGAAQAGKERQEALAGAVTRQWRRLREQLERVASSRTLPS